MKIVNFGKSSELNSKSDIYCTSLQGIINTMNGLETFRTYAIFMTETCVKEITNNNGIGTGRGIIAKTGSSIYDVCFFCASGPVWIYNVRIVDENVTVIYRTQLTKLETVII